MNNSTIGGSALADSGEGLGQVRHAAASRPALVTGFSLPELMVVVAIIAILAAIAIPSYSNYVVKTNRAAAEACLSKYANCMERYYTTNLRYDHDTSSA